MSRGRRKKDDSTLGCVIYAILALIAMPIVGVFLIGSKEPTKNIWGWVLLIVGLIIWGIMLF